MHPLETYLHELYEIRSSGSATAETSYYPPLANLLNEIGKALKPRVRSIMNLKNLGAGLPDGGLFTSEQLPKSGPSPISTPPSRGAIEVKPTADDAWLTADTAQVSRYWQRYRQVLVTNLRDFVFVGEDEDGRPVKLETYRLAGSEKEFWAAAAHPHKTAREQGERFLEYLKRVMVYAAPLASPQDVAWFLASYARDARLRLESVDLPALAGTKDALEQGLGLKFEGHKGEHFFRSTLVQTLFYGVFSGWVLWGEQRPHGDRRPFDWRTTAYHLRVPIIRKLFHELAEPGQLQELRLDEVLDWAAAALNRVKWAPFFAKFEQGQAVQYFYEPFLQAYDPELRKELGVWYTPPEIVQYMVERVDTVLREELGLADGLADPSVYVLDPCCGTGAYLVEVLKRIQKTAAARGADALAADDLKRAAQERVFGFEILPAPFAISHLQVGLFLQQQGAPFAANERAGIYLTNSLTGWEPPQGPRQQLSFPELEAERSAADRVKQTTPVLVVLGNPPYNAFAGVSPKEGQGLVEPYKRGLITQWGIKKFNLDDLYVRFFRLAERRVAEMTGRGVVCYISNFSYLSDPSFVVMRERFLAEFNALWFDCLNGDSRETGKLTPDGHPDPSIFSTELNPEGIRVGTAIGLMVRRGQGIGGPVVRFRQFWGTNKRAELVRSLAGQDPDSVYSMAAPSPGNRFSFRPTPIGSAYQSWPKLTDLAEDMPLVGLEECRGGALIEIDRGALQERMQVYLNPGVEWGELASIEPRLTRNAPGFDARRTRANALALESYSDERICRYVARPFDMRYCYYSSIPTLWNRSRPTLWEQCSVGNLFLVSRMHSQASPEGAPMLTARHLFDKQTISRNPGGIPIRLHQGGTRGTQAGQGNLPLASHANTIANLSSVCRAYLAALGMVDPDADEHTSALVWLHALAVGYSPAYLAENADGIRQDWPRVPLPTQNEDLLASATLGRQLATLLDTESSVLGVTEGSLRPELQAIGLIARVGGGNLNPAAGDLAITVGWGHAGQGGVTMPGRGKLTERAYDQAELATIEAGARGLGLSLAGALAQLGDRTYDVYLNDVAYQRNVPVNVWRYAIGGYQVIKKWLSYREKRLLGRDLRVEEVREVRDMARRIAAILLLQPRLDDNYRRAKANTYSWPGGA